MHQEITTKRLLGNNDLTLTAPIRQGLIGALDTLTYASRLRRVLKTLHTLRVTSREYSLLRTISDSTDRIRTISDLRIAILEPEQKLLLSVSFDQPWEPYLRTIWRDVGSLLDIIFCNCEGYVTSFDHSFAEYGAWVRQARVNTQFFYKTHALTVDDVQYLRQTEKLLRREPPGNIDLAAAQLTAADPADTAARNMAAQPFEGATQGLQALSVLYRLVDQFPPDHPDGLVLRLASRQLLKELVPVSPHLPPGARLRFAAPLAWFESPLPLPAPRAGRSPASYANVQSGIVSARDGITHGALLLFSLRDAAAGAPFLKALRPKVVAEGGARPAGVAFVNVAFTIEGLRLLGVPATELAAFPAEFLEGMEDRAGLLGDVRGNHPRNWSLPVRNWPAPAVPKAGDGPAVVSLSAVHVVVQLSVASGSAEHEIVGNAAHPLYAAVQGLATLDGATLQSVQATRRFTDAAFPGQRAREHFGFLDGISQPEIGTPAGGPSWGNQVPIGEVLLGYPNAQGDVPETSALRLDGSFLVVRKLRQDVRALNDALDAAIAGPAHGMTRNDLKAKMMTRNDLKAKMMGRTVDGDALASPASPTVPPMNNAFDYSADPTGAQCPLQAHVRRANPRQTGTDHRSPTPRIVRRGMSYGPRFKQDEPDAERGILFMAYNASIAEQFEVVQRWISGGNSTGLLSDQGDPFLGVPQVGPAVSAGQPVDDTRSFRFHDGSRAIRVVLDKPEVCPARPFVKLEWGVYLFAPSIPALKMVQDLAAAAASAGKAPAPVDADLVEDGERTIGKLRALEHQIGPAAADLWKAALEDSEARSTRSAEAVWAAIRARHHGVLRTPYGVLVADAALVDAVFVNARGDYSVSGYADRLRQSIGEIYLGLDDGPPYRGQADLPNAAISSVTEPQAFDAAYAVATQVLAGLVKGTQDAARHALQPTWELTLDIKELSDLTLAQLCRLWFDIPDGTFVVGGGWRWDWQAGQPPLCPGHFTAPSRYLFQPNPGAAAQRYGQTHGQALGTAVLGFVSDRRAHGLAPTGTLSAAIFAAFPEPGSVAEGLIARTLIGTLMGFLPTVDGNLRATLYEWLDKRTFWDLQARWTTDPRPTNHPKAVALLGDALRRTMQLRPVPELVWRTAVRTHRLGRVEVRSGDKIVVGIVSATQQTRAAGGASVCPVFGGDRRSMPAPTHACPGQSMGMGVLLGVIAALMGAGPWRATPAPLTVSLRGPVP